MYRRNAQGWSKHIDFILIEEIALQMAYILASLGRHHSLPYGTPIYRNLGLALALIDALVVMLFNSMHNVLKRDFLQELYLTVKHCLIVFLCATAYMFVVKEGSGYSRIVLFFTLFFHILCGYTLREIWKQILLKYGIPTRRKRTMIAVLDNPSAERMIERLKNNHIEGYQLIGIVLSESTDTKELGGIPVVAALEDASDYVCREWVDSVYVDCPSTDPRIAKFMDDCHQMAVPVHYHVPGMSREGVKRFVEHVGGTTVLTTSINYATPIQAFAKRTLDIIGGLVGSVLTLLIIAVVGPMIKKASPGPILYTQERIGKNGKRFRIINVFAEPFKIELCNNRTKMAAVMP